MDAFGRVDILVANAGILRDKSFGKMELKDFAAVMDVHLMGTVKPCKAVWQIMRDQQYGRIVVTTSSTGLYGNFGQTNYGAAKASLVGFMNSLKLEGAKDNIKVNAVCPVAGTRMTENLMPPNVLEMLKPEFVTPGRCVPGERGRPQRRDPDGGGGRVRGGADRRNRRRPSRPEGERRRRGGELGQDRRLLDRDLLFPRLGAVPEALRPAARPGGLWASEVKFGRV